MLRDRCVLMNLLTNYDMGRMHIKRGDATKAVMITLSGYEDTMEDDYGSTKVTKEVLYWNMFAVGM